MPTVARDRETNQLAIHKNGRRFELRTNPASGQGWS